MPKGIFSYFPLKFQPNRRMTFRLYAAVCQAGQGLAKHRTFGTRPGLGKLRGGL